MMALVDRIEAWLARLETVFLVVANTLLGLMLVFNFVNILVRTVSDRGLLWVFPWTTALFVWCTFVGMFVVYRRGTDIAVDYFYVRMGPGGQMALRIFADVVVIAVLLVLLAVAPSVLAQMQGDIELTFLRRWMLAVPLFVSSFLVALDVALDLARAAHGLPSRTRGHGAVL